MKVEIFNSDLSKTLTVIVFGESKKSDFKKNKRFLIPVGDSNDIGFYVGYNSYTRKYIFECWNPKNGRATFSDISQIKNINQA